MMADESMISDEFDSFFNDLFAFSEDYLIFLLGNLQFSFFFIIFAAQKDKMSCAL